MNALKLIIFFLLSSWLGGCSTLPIQSNVKEGHFRLESFRLIDGSREERIGLMCYNNRPTHRQNAIQAVAGEQVFWIKAEITNQGLPNRTKEAFVKVPTNLEAGKEYTINRKIEDDSISVWIQDLETDKIVSPIVDTTLKFPAQDLSGRQRHQCQSSSV